MQVGVGLVDPINRRMVDRGGGADILDYLVSILAAENCSELCYFGMMFGAFGNYWYNLPNYNGYHIPHYLKCFGASALNGLRLQLASQFNTLDLDQTVPQMNVTDWKACMRMCFEFWIEINTRIIYIHFFKKFIDRTLDLKIVQGFNY